MIRKTLIICALSAVAEQSSTRVSISDDVVKIGVLNDMSSLYSDGTGKGSLTAAQMAMADFGGSVRGKPIEVISADHLNKPDVGSMIARSWYDTNNVDAIVDVTETGSTLRAHGMKVIETLLESEVLLMANRTSAADPVKRAAMDDITTLLLGALRAEGRVLIKLNVSEENLRAVLDVVPSMKSPTVSQLSDGGYAIETVVDKATVNTLIPLLKAKGATDILELPISKIVP